MPVRGTTTLARWPTRGSSLGLQGLSTGHSRYRHQVHARRHVGATSLRAILDAVRAPKRRRPRRRTLTPPPAGVDLKEVAKRVTYVGSANTSHFLRSRGRHGFVRTPASVTRTWRMRASSLSGCRMLSPWVR
jgi:hypothetical protein